MREEFDFDVALAALQDGQGLTGPLCQGSCPLLYFSLFFRWAGSLTWDTHRNADLRC